MINFKDELVSHLFEGVYVVDTNRKIIFWNEGSERITGYTAKEVINNHCYNNILQHVDHTGKKLCFNGCPLHKTLETGEIQKSHVFLRHKSGFRIPVMVKSLPIHGENNEIVAAIEVFTDERFQRNNYMEKEALKDELMKDPLTAISNRKYFEFTLTKFTEKFQQFKQDFGILMFDIDHFKRVNDTYGHLVGDEILKVVANSLSENTKKTDLISRWGGEEFIGLFEVNSHEELEHIAKRLRIVVENSSFVLENGRPLSVTISVGGAMMHEDYQPKHIIDQADQALYQSKRDGRNRVTIKK